MSLEHKIGKAKSLLSEIEKNFTPAVFANSFGAEDMVLTDLITEFSRRIEVFTLDTGRLPQETFLLMEQVANRYSLPIKVYFPASSDVENYVAQHGPNAFYESVERRKECCRIRKVEPFKRAVQGKAAWITGVRREQATTRTGLSESEFDNAYGLHKFSPLLEWNLEDVWAYIRKFEVPYNELHDKGYPSIGCAPCTRATVPGEDIRAGRWWWENPTRKECGLHPKKASG
jgi:phosphoadenosine phosphosulfate reductase